MYHFYFTKEQIPQPPPGTSSLSPLPYALLSRILGTVSVLYYLALKFKKERGS